MWNVGYVVFWLGAAFGLRWLWVRDLRERVRGPWRWEK